MTDTTITTAALADLFGITTRSIRDLKKRGIVVAVGKEFALADSARGWLGLRQITSSLKTSASEARCSTLGPLKTNGAAFCALCAPGYWQCRAGRSKGCRILGHMT
jgi:hypothetical protein